MPLSTEIFVMLIFIAGLPFYYFLLRDPQLEGCQWFLAAYIFLVLSNIATVAEEFFWNQGLNFFEHLFIALSSVMFVMAILKLTRTSGSKSRQKTDPPHL